MKTPISPLEAGVWLYGEAIPKGLLSQQQSDLLTRTLSLSQCPSVPDNLIENLLNDTDKLLDKLLACVSSAED